ncbi:hypothetical protein OIO90_000815 [Microbotryomycetes sp. JL221]|nr:hypothetical protein OIO90_000815 [Microbotryomycetes sp. JL221]
MPGFHSHALEVLLELASFLSTRYPRQFAVTRSMYDIEKRETWGDSISGQEAGRIKVIRNLITGEEFDLMKIENEEGPEWNPMKVAGLLTPDDLVVMIEDDNGEYRFQAGSVVAAGTWRVDDKIGCTLHEIHTSGRGVPMWREKLKPSMERFFQKLKVDKPFERNNYFFQTDPALSWAAANGPEAIFDQKRGGPIPDLLQTSEEPHFKAHGPPEDASKIWFRTERQTLRRMPLTGGILFTIKTQLIPVVDIAQEPGAPGRLASSIRAWPQSVSEYKGGPRWLDVLLPYLDREHQRQLDSGEITLNSDGEVEGALRYPW